MLRQCSQILPINMYIAIEILSHFDPEVQLINTKSMIKNKLKELLSEFKNFKVQIILVECA